MTGKSSKADAKARVAIVGAGKLASALAVSLHDAGYVLDQIISRRKAASLKRARALAEQVGATALAGSGAEIRSEVVWFCVPDGIIRKAAKQLRNAADWRDKIALHSSGVLTSDELSELRRRGAAVASAHPLMTFVREAAGRGVHSRKRSLKGVPFAIEGDAAAVRAARGIVKDLGGRAHAIRREDKGAYHAWGTFASPLLTALLVTSEHVAGAAGIERTAAKKRMLPMLRQTLENYADFDAAGAFSGAIIRGDVATVERHLRTLSDMPSAQAVYVALAQAAMHYMPGKNRRALEKVLREYS